VKSEPHDNGDDEDSAVNVDIEVTRVDGSPFPSSLTTLGQNLLQEAVPPELLRRLRKGRTTSITVIVPEGWRACIRAALDNWCSRSTTIVDWTKKPSNNGVTRALYAAGTGTAVAHVAEDPKHVPASVRSPQDRCFRLTGISETAVRATLRLCTRGRVSRTFAPDLTAASLLDVASAIVPGARTKHAMSALRALSESTKVSAVTSASDLPPLEECVEYGPLREWGLQLGRDLAAWSRGELPASDLDSSILLASAPGLGKTTFVRILSKHLQARLITLSVGDLFRGGSYLDNAVANISKSFDEARQNAPSLLFLDEVDNFSSRGEGRSNDHYFNSLTNHILSQLDGIGSDTEGVVIIGATNRPDAVDPALRRPGRLSRTIEVLPPDEEGRSHVLRTQLRSDLADERIDEVVARTVDFSPADLMQLVVQARTLARREGIPLQMQHLIRVTAPAARSPEQIWRSAVHEAGHAIAALRLPESGCDLVFASLSAEEGIGGRTRVTMQKRPRSRQSIDDQVAVLLAGRAAEQTLLGDEPTSGAGGSEASDLASATELIASAIVSFGLHGSLAWRAPPSDAVALMKWDPALRAEVEDCLERQLARARDIVESDRKAVETLATALVERRLVKAAEISRMLKREDNGGELR